MSEPQAWEVQDFVDFLMTRADRTKWEAWQRFMENAQFAESGMSDYLSQLEGVCETAGVG